MTPSSNAASPNSHATTPSRVILIRHAEKPDETNHGVDAFGNPDAQSLTPRGWQRAGALIRYFSSSREDSSGGCRTPDTIFAAGVGPGSESKRSVQTAAPLADRLAAARGTPFVTTHLRQQVEPLVRDVLQRSGIVLICWQHKRIAEIARRIAPEISGLPPVWPEERFDLLWILDRAGDCWTLSRKAQCLLAGDADSPD